MIVAVLAGIVIMGVSAVFIIGSIIAVAAINSIED